MNKLFMLKLFLITITLLVCASCNSDDNENFEIVPDNSDETGSSPDVINKDLSNLIGFWDSDIPQTGDLLLFDDGTGYLGGGSTFPDGDLRKWGFDQKNNYLTISGQNGFILLITYHDAETIVGVRLSDNKSLSYTKYDNAYWAVHTIINGSWVSETNNGLEIGYNMIQYEATLPPVAANGYSNSYKISCQGTSYDELKYQIYINGKDNLWVPYKTGMLSIENPFKPAQTKLIFKTGPIIGTFKRQTNK